MRKFNLRGLCAIVILELILVSPINAQNNLSSNNQKYNVNVGDSITYHYITVFNGNNNYFEDSVTLANSKVVYFNITQGLVFTVKVNSISGTNVETQIIFQIPSKGQIITEPSSYTIPYLNKAFENYSVANKYVQDTNSSDNQYSISGDYITEYIDNPLDQITTVTNWRTGWIKTYDVVDLLDNGSIYQEFSFTQINASSIIDINTIFTVAIFVSIPSFFIIGALLARKVKKKKDA